MNIMERPPPGNDPLTPDSRTLRRAAALGTHVHPPRDDAGSRFLGRNNEAREEGVHEANMHGFANAWICSVAGRIQTRARFPGTTALPLAAESLDQRP